MIKSILEMWQHICYSIEKQHFPLPTIILDAPDVIPLK